MQLTTSDVVFDERKTVALAYAEGDIFPYEDYSLPKLFCMPLKIKENGERRKITGYKSGERSCILKDDGKWFKYKGMAPTNKTHVSGEPVGGMSKENCDRELLFSELLDEKYKEFGFRGPLNPAGKSVFEIPFNRHKVHAAILETRGDKRLSLFGGHVYRKFVKNPELLSSKHVETLFKKLNCWCGFANRILEEAKILPIDVSFDDSNYTLYDVGSGFGVGRVDLSSAKISEWDGLSAESGYAIFNGTNSIPFATVVLKTAKKLNLELNGLLEDYNEMGDLMLEEVESERYEKLEEKSFDYKNDKNGDEKIPYRLLHISKKRFQWLENIRSEYYAGLDGDKAPEPIERKLVERLF